MSAHSTVKIDREKAEEILAQYIISDKESVLMGWIASMPDSEIERKLDQYGDERLLNYMIVGDKE